MFLYKIDEDLSLKVAEVRDAEQIFELTDQSREYLREWLPWLDITTKVEDTRNFIQSTLKGFSENRSMTTVIMYQGKIAGLASYNLIDHSNRVAHIGYWLGEQYQGHGIMTRVAKALTNYAINELHLNRVEIRAAEHNTKSRSIPERLGFTKEGHIRQAEWLYDHFVDHIVYGMLAEDWNRQ